MATMRHAPLAVAMPGRLVAYAQLMRLDKPVGTALLLWPTLAALWMAAGGAPAAGILAAFVAGTFLMRSCGCVINDIADRNIDGLVERTAGRPLAQGRVSVAEAAGLFAALAALALAVVLTLNRLTQALALVGIAAAVAYPFAKRITHLPQVLLGIAFSWGIPMAFAAVTGAVPPTAWALTAASVVWVVAYDTQYAMADRRDDLRAGVKSAAILFGRRDRAAVAALQCAALGGFFGVGVVAHLGVGWNVALLAASALFAHQQWLLGKRQPAAYLKAFRSNAWVGFALFAGVAWDYAA